MSTINPLSREVSAKIVYVGPGLSGKTTSLQYIHSRLNPDTRSDLLSLATEDDRTLFFDFLPLRIPRVHGLGVRLQLYTVPGQVFYAATRKLVLNGADGVVFVADAQRARREANIESLAGMWEHLEEHGISSDSFPLVFQYNKQDLETKLELSELRADLNPRSLPEFCSTAVEGTGVVETLRAIVREVVAALGRNAQVRKIARPYLPATEDSSLRRRLSAFVEQRNGRAGASEERLSDSAQAGDRTTATSLSELSHASPVVLDSEIGFEPPEAPRDQTDITTERPTAGVSFGALWDANQRAPIAIIESCISAGRFHDAVHHSASAVALLLGRLPLPSDTPMGTRATLVGLDGQEYLRLCRLASQPKETIEDADALFALYMLIGTRLKVAGARV